MRGKTLRFSLLLLGALLLGAAAEDDPQAANAAPATTPAGVVIRTGTHPGFGRVVIAVEHGPPPRFSRDGDRLLVSLPGQDAAGSAPPPPRNVRALLRAPGRVEITIAPGATFRTSRERGRLIIDVLDPPAAVAPAQPPIQPAPGARTAPAPAAQPATTPPAGAAIEPVQALPLPTTPLSPTPQPPAAPSIAPDPLSLPHAAVAAAPASQAEPAPPPAGPAALAVRALPAEAGGGVFVPFEAGVGAAAFRRGPLGLVVFDQRRPLDLSGLRGHPSFGAASVHLLAGGTVLRLPVPPEAELALERQAEGWRLVVAPRTAGTPLLGEPIRATREDVRLVFAAGGAGRVVTMTDPETGATVLIGTLRRAGAIVPTERHWATFTVARSWLGLVVEPLSDDLALRPQADGFALTAGAGSLPLGGETDDGERMAQAATTARLFGFASQSREALRGQQRMQLQEAGGTPPLARGPVRRVLGLTLLSLGLAAEAQTVLQVAAADDPREAEAPETIGLTAIAALLAGRMDEAAGLDDPRLGDAQDVRFWRAVKLAKQTEGAPTAAAEFARAGKLLQSYPEPLRDRLSPLVAETLVLGGQADAAREILAQAPDAPALGYARALLLQADGDGAKALAALDALTTGRDRLLRARAGARAAELRLARGDLTPEKAAAALERLLFAWRDDARDLALRLRVAELRVQAGTWRPALALLRESEILFPDEKPTIQARLRQSVAQLLQEAAMERMPPLDLVALVDENAELMPNGEAGADVAARLSDRLMALDLPRRAAPLLQKLIGTTAAGPTRAQFGARLAALRLQEADPAGARVALDASAAADLPDALAGERTILAARAQARLGDPVAAVAQLASLDSEPALRARAAILEETQNWPQAAEALRALVARTMPGEGKLDEAQQRSLLRLATAAAQAGDTTLLAQLREKETPRLSPGPVADLFRLLTSDSVQGVADLPRAGRELALARALSADPARR